MTLAKYEMQIYQMGKWCVSWDLMKVFLLLLYCIILIHKKIYVFFLLNLRLKFMWGYRQIRFLCPYKDVLLWGLCNDQWALWTLSKALCICRKHVSGWDSCIMMGDWLHTIICTPLFDTFSGGISSGILGCLILTHWPPEEAAVILN